MLRVLQLVLLTFGCTQLATAQDLPASDDSPASDKLAAAEGPAAKKIVFLTATETLSTHKAESSLRLIQLMIGQLEIATPIETEFHEWGWPTDPKTFDDAAAIVVFADGNKENRLANPIFVGDRAAIIEKQIDRGCGFVAIHSALEVGRDRGGIELQRWLGGYFDESAVTVRVFGDAAGAALPIQIVAKAHPIARGLSTFKLVGEDYVDATLAKQGVTKVLATESGTPVAWASETPGRGRGFAFSAGHLQETFSHPAFRRGLLNGILWSAGIEVPKNGVQSKTPSEMTSRERSQLTVQLRKQADAHFNAYAKSGGADLRQLELFADKFRRVLAIFDKPEDCPECYLDYARGQRFLGIYFGIMRHLATQELEKVGDGEKGTIRQLIQDADAKNVRYFIQSNRGFEFYLEQASNPKPDLYNWLSEQKADVGEFADAIKYLDLFISKAKLDARDRAPFDTTRKTYVRLLREQGGAKDEKNTPTP